MSRTTGMHAVAAGDGVGRGVTLLPLSACRNHRPEHIREADVFLRGDVHADVAQFAQAQVLRFCVGIARPTNRTRRALNDAHAVGLERLHDGGGGLAIAFAHFRRKGAVAVVVHAIAGRRNGRLEREAVVGHAAQEARRGFAAPAVLAGGDCQLWHADRQVGLHDAGIQFLLRDGVSDDGEAVARFEHETGRLRRFARLELLEARIVRLVLQFTGGLCSGGK